VSEVILLFEEDYRRLEEASLMAGLAKWGEPRKAAMLGSEWRVIIFIWCLHLNGQNDDSTRQV